MTTILHVEDDELLASVVQGAFEAFGFLGRFLVASTLKEAKGILAQPEQHLDLVISDMELPDGSGLDVVSAVRSNLKQSHVPILILSGHDDVRTVSRAYALGANCYVKKTARERTATQIVRTLYDHWLQDAQLPVKVGNERMHSVIARAISIRIRIAQSYMTIAEQFGSAHGDFWMGVAQREGNMANLLRFLLGQVKDRELPNDILDKVEVHQNNALRVLDELEAGPPITEDHEDDAFRFLLALSALPNIPAFIRSVGLLFPASPLALTALLDAHATTFETASAQIEARTRDPALLQGASQLREKAAWLRSGRR
jgi:DNA-binding NarL/FixJ family response regulator